MKFVSIQATYSQSHLALFDKTSCLEVVSYRDLRSSSHLVPLIEQLLQNHRLTLSDITFLALDKGPGAFTSLRVAIATVNGIAFSHKIPLVGISGLDALLHDMRHEPGYHIALLNAYNNDVYFAISDPQGTFLSSGCSNITTLLETLGDHCNHQSMVFSGNSAIQFKDIIKEMFGSTATMASNVQETAGVETIGLLAFEEFKRQEKHEYSITPLYMKTQLFAVRQNQVPKK